MTAIWNLCGPDFLIETAQATAHMRKERPHGDMSIHTSTYVRWVTMYWITGIVTLMIVSVLLAAGTLGAGEARPSLSEKQMSQDRLIKLALSAAPTHITKGAAVMVQGEDGKLVESRKGTNGFTCVPMADPNVPTRDPMCTDHAAFQWFTSLMNNEEPSARPRASPLWGRGA